MTEGDHFEIEFIRYLAVAHQPKASKKKYIQLDKRLKAVQKLANVGRLDLLRSIAINFELA